MFLVLKKLSLFTRILIGLVGGVGIGIFLGEHAGGLKIVGDAFIGLLQMTVLPYIAFALMANIGRLRQDESGRFAKSAGLFLLVSYAVSLIAVVLMPLAFPPRESASFFSTSLLESPDKIDFLALFIPSNPFQSFANNVVPAAVLFCICMGVAIMSFKNKHVIVEQLDFLATALARINRYVVRLTPIGVFAIAASTAGTMEFGEIMHLQAYIIPYTVAVVVVGFGVLPALMASLTPFSYREILGVSRAPLMTAFVTGKVFVVLPMLVESAEELFSRHNPDPEKPKTIVRAVTPLVYPFPHAGRLLALLFVPFAAWFVDDPIRITQYPSFLFAGLFSFFGSPVVAMPFLLDMQQIPSDMFQLFIVSGLYAARLGDMLGAMHILFVSVLTASALSGGLHVRFSRVVGSLALMAGLWLVAVIGTQSYLNRTLSGEYEKDRVVANMHTAVHGGEAFIHREVPSTVGDADDSRPVLKRIQESGVLRVGYHPDNLPYSFFNASGDLVGFDVDMAHLIARQLGCRLEFVPFDFLTMDSLLERGTVDVIMSGVAMVPERLHRMRFSGSYMDVTAALIVKDHRRDEFLGRIERRDFKGTRIGFVRIENETRLLDQLFPGADPVRVPSIREFLETGGTEADALIGSAEAGSAWTLLYPDFSVVVAEPLFRVPVAYPVRPESEDLADFLSRWIELSKAANQHQRLYDHWILGRDAQSRSPRWSVVRNVLHWVD